MAIKDPRVDAYIADSAPFARPILRHLRTIVHAGCPDVEETMKWSFPHFMHKGILCSMASFKNHCAFGFWKGALLVREFGPPSRRGDAAMGQFGRITAVTDLPDESTLLRFVRAAVALNDLGVKARVRARPRGDRTLKVPDYFMVAVRKNKKALATFGGFTYSKKKEYVEWVTEARGEETRRRRLDTAVAWMSEGKARNWKYVRK